MMQSSKIALFGLLVLFIAGFVTNSSAQTIADLTEILEDEGLEWLTPIPSCPADLMQDKNIKVQPEYRSCQDYLGKCVEDCQKGNPERCFTAAVTHQSLENDGHALSLFGKACALGVAVGCTNLAASLRFGDVGSGTCNAKTFEKTCALNEPWGCAMSAVIVANGEGVPRDQQKAKNYAERTCALSPDSDPCDLANDVIADNE